MAIQRGPSKSITSGLVLYLDAANPSSYPGSGTTWNDLSGNNNHGTLTNGPTFNSANGGSIVFDGTDDFVNVANAASLNATTQTINIWHNTTINPARTATIIGKHDTTGSFNGYNIFTQNSAQIKAASGGGATSVGTAGGTTSVWYFLTLTFSINGTATFYVNGVSNSSAACVNFTMSSNPLRIGRSPDSFWSVYTGRIAVVQVYNRVLTATEVLQNYNVTKSRFGL
jgi:hypothetical protein